MYVWFCVFVWYIFCLDLKIQMLLYLGPSVSMSRIFYLLELYFQSLLSCGFFLHPHCITQTSNSFMLCTTFLTLMCTCMHTDTHLLLAEFCNEWRLGFSHASRSLQKTCCWIPDCTRHVISPINIKSSKQTFVLLFAFFVLFLLVLRFFLDDYRTHRPVFKNGVLCPEDIEEVCDLLLSELWTTAYRNSNTNPTGSNINFRFFFYSWWHHTEWWSHWKNVFYFQIILFTQLKSYI